MRARRGHRPAPPPPWRREADLHGYDLALLVAAVVSFGLAQLANRAISDLGGFYLHAIPAQSQISPWATVPAQVRTLGQNLMYLFGSNFWVKPQVLTDYAYLHLIGLAVALIGLLIALWSWPRADRVTRTLVVGLFALFAASRGEPADAADLRRARDRDHGSVRRGPGRPRHRAVAGRARGREGRSGPGAALGAAGWVRAPTARAAVACVLVAAGIGYLCNLGYNAAQPSRPSVNQALADWLVAHHLTSGIGGYWDADVTALGSGGKVTIAPVVDGARYGYPWESKASWFDPKGRSANFIIAHVQQLGAGYLSVSLATDRYGKPAREYFLGQTVVVVYDRNLLKSVIRPTPGPSSGHAGRPEAGIIAPADQSFCLCVTARTR